MFSFKPKIKIRRTSKLGRKDAPTSKANKNQLRRLSTDIQCTAEQYQLLTRYLLACSMCTLFHIISPY